MKSFYHLSSKSVTETEKSDRIGESSLPESSLPGPLMVEAQTSSVSEAFKESEVNPKLLMKPTEATSKEVTVNTWIQLEISRPHAFKR